MMTCMLDSIRPFDVLIASVEFEDKPGVAKPRPVVVLEVDRLGEGGPCKTLGCSVFEDHAFTN